jgi:hypothetical protein
VLVTAAGLPDRDGPRLLALLGQRLGQRLCTIALAWADTKVFAPVRTV